MSPPKRQRREDDTVTPESLLRLRIFSFQYFLLDERLFSALKNNENNRLSRYHRFEIASRRAAFDNFQVKTKDIVFYIHFPFDQLLDRRHRKQSNENEKLHEKSAPTYAKVT